MRKLKNAAVVAVGLLAFSGVSVGAAQADATYPPNTDYTITGHFTDCFDAVHQSAQRYGTPDDIHRFQCMLNEDNTAADLNYA
ncbi:hypothetical protein [Streptomyces sp. NPDC054765]